MNRDYFHFWYCGIYRTQYNLSIIVEIRQVEHLCAEFFFSIPKKLKKKQKKRREEKQGRRLYLVVIQYELEGTRNDHKITLHIIQLSVIHFNLVFLIAPLRYRSHLRVLGKKDWPLTSSFYVLKHSHCAGAWWAWGEEMYWFCNKSSVSLWFVVKLNSCSEHVHFLMMVHFLDCRFNLIHGRFHLIDTV